MFGLASVVSAFIVQANRVLLYHTLWHQNVWACFRGIRLHRAGKSRFAISHFMAPECLGLLPWYPPSSCRQIAFCYITLYGTKMFGLASVVSAFIVQANRVL